MLLLGFEVELGLVEPVVPLTLMLFTTVALPALERAICSARSLSDCDATVPERTIWLLLSTLTLTVLERVGSWRSAD